MLFTGLGFAFMALIVVWALAICAVVANAFELPVPWRLGRFERPVMYGAFFMGGGAFWILAFGSSALGLAALVASLVVVPFAGLLIGRMVGERHTADRPVSGSGHEDLKRSPTEPPRAA